MSNVKSDLLNELRELVKNCERIENIGEVNAVIKVIDSLGENAHRNLEIGILQDELVRLGFEPRHHKNSFVYRESNKIVVYVEFLNDGVFLLDFGHYSYDSPGYQQDVLTKIKELIK